MADRNQTDRLGVNAVEKIFLEMGWIFREQSISDYGVDAQAEPRRDGEASGQLIALQIKTGASYFRKRGDVYIYTGEARHLAYWTNHVLPVFIVLHDPVTCLTLWQRIDRRLVTERPSGGWSIEIPANNILDKGAEPFLRRGIPSDPASVRRVRLALDLPLIEAVDARTEDGSAYLRVFEWVNKSLNFRDAIFVFDDDPDGEIYEEIRRLTPAHDLDDYMATVFPWLHHDSVDDPEDHPEVVEHVLEVRVNEVGKALLTLEDYYREGIIVHEDFGQFGPGDGQDETA